jgi:aminoglycoside phosphotransferase (APT) family kinase protein
MTSLPPLVDNEALGQWLSQQLPGNTSPLISQRVGEGHSNLTFLIKRGEEEFILRRPPRPPYLPTAHDVIREWRLISALSKSNLAVPVPILSCEDLEVIGAPFYLMSRMDGYVIRSEMPPEFDSEAGRREVTDELIKTLVTLHAVDYQAIGLGNLGKPEGYLGRQIKRWTGQLEGAFTRPLPDLLWVGDWLRDHLPESPTATIVHGDYRLDNVVVGKGSPAKVAAVLDWEMATLGDPLADVGYLMSFWVDPDDEPIDFNLEMGKITVQPGSLRRQEAIERYAELSGRKVSNLSFYIALAIWKLAILLEGSYKRHQEGTTDDPFFATLKEGVPALAARAKSVCEASGL